MSTAVVLDSNSGLTKEEARELEKNIWTVRILHMMSS